MSGDRLEIAWRGAVGAVTHGARYYGAYEFEVLSGDSSKVDARPTDPSIGLPEMVAVPTYTSAAGEVITYAAGTKILLTFVNGSPSRPVVISQDATKPVLEYALDIAGPATVTATGALKLVGATVQLGEGAPLPVAYQTSPVVAGPFAGTVTLGSTTVSVVP